MATETITEEQEMLRKHHLALINQLNEVIVNQRQQINALQQTADSSVTAINKMSHIIGEQNERVNQLKLKVQQLKQGQFIQNGN